MSASVAPGPNAVCLWPDTEEPTPEYCVSFALDEHAAKMGDDAEAATRYRQRAEEVRVIAESSKDPKTRKTLLGISADYERMAQSLDRIAETDRQIKTRQRKSSTPGEGA
ncbi:MAG TPA: hypothetical protein VN579_03030 [Bryobacteraceae bacterium]|nr:hypothetical protein [Bryobacteraceae bacterium]